MKSCVTWVYSLKGVRRVLYNLPDVITATHVIVVEGEKVANRVRRERRGLEDWISGSRWAVTTTCGGAEGWGPAYGVSALDCKYPQFQV